MAYKPSKQTNSPFGKAPQKRSYNKDESNKYIDNGGSGGQDSNDWVTVKSSLSSNNSSKPTYSYNTNKPPRRFKITPKNKKLPQKPNLSWHSNPERNPSATVCAVCTKKVDNSYIVVDGIKLHRACFKCAKCKKILNHQAPSTYTKVKKIYNH